MLTYVIGDLFQSPARVLVNTVNIVGVMGKGIAKDFKLIFPEMFREYQRLCEAKQLDVGQLQIYRASPKWILNFPTKKHWRQPSRPEYIEAGLKTFVRTYASHSITSIAFPPLGCGNGELDWEQEVRPLMEQYLRPLPIDVYIHLYQKEEFAPEHRDIKETKRWLRSEPESLAFVEVWSDLQELLADTRQFTSFLTHRRFTARVTSDPGLSILINNGASVFVHQDAILDLWQFVRNAGFVTEEGLTHGLDAHAEEVFTLLRELPYLKITKVVPGQYGDDPLHALQLVPRSALRQRDLFSERHTVGR